MSWVRQVIVRILLARKEEVRMPSSVRSREHPADQSVDWPGKTTPEEMRSAVVDLRFAVPRYRELPSVFSTGVMVPNSPCCSPSGPALKYIAVADPEVLPLPNESAHNPSMVIG